MPHHIDRCRNISIDEPSDGYFGPLQQICRNGSASTQSGKYLLRDYYLRAERSLDRLFEPQRQENGSPRGKGKLRGLPFQLMEGAGRIVRRRPLHFTYEEGVPRRALGHNVDLQGLAIQAGSPPAAGGSPGSPEGFERGHACPRQLFQTSPAWCGKLAATSLSTAAICRASSRERSGWTKRNQKRRKGSAIRERVRLLLRTAVPYGVARATRSISISRSKGRDREVAGFSRRAAISEARWQP